MADGNITFYYSKDQIPDRTQDSNGKIYFVLKEENSNIIDSIIFDIENQRYTMSPVITEVTSSKTGLMIPADKVKLDLFNVSNSGTELTINSLPINFNEIIKQKGSKVLTEDSIFKVEIESISDDAEEESQLFLREGENENEWVFKLKLPIKGKDFKFKENVPVTIGKDNVNISPHGTATIVQTNEEDYEHQLQLDLYNLEAKIDEQADASIINDSEETRAIVTSSRNENDEQHFDFKFYNIKGNPGQDGDKGDKGEKGDKGDQVPIYLRFVAGGSSSIPNTVEPVLIKPDPNDSTKDYYLFTIPMPKGEKGDTGKNFEITKFYETIKDMAKDNLENKIAISEFILIEKEDEKSAEYHHNTEVGYLYFKIPNIDSSTAAILNNAKNEFNGLSEAAKTTWLNNSDNITAATIDLRYLTDMSPTQPEFSVESEVSILKWDQQGSVSIDNETNGLDHPKLTFSLPRGKPLDVWTEPATFSVDKTYPSGNSQPQVTVTAEEITRQDDADYRAAKFNFAFKNMGTKIDGATGTVGDGVYYYNTNNNEFNEDAIPTVAITPRTERDNTEQYLDFAFDNILGTPAVIDTVHVNVGNGINGDLGPNNQIKVPSGEGYFERVGNPKYNKWDFYLTLDNITGKKGSDGSWAAISQIGDGNAVTDIIAAPAEDNQGNIIENKYDLVIKKDDNFAYANDTATMLDEISTIRNDVNPLKNRVSILEDKVETDKNNITSLQNNLTSTSNTLDGLLDDGIVKISKGGTGATGFTNGAFVVAGADALTSSYGVGPVRMSQNYSTGKYEISYGTNAVKDGGTGQTWFPREAILLGNGASALQYVEAQEGAFFASEMIANNEPIIYPHFGTLPISYGGTGATSLADSKTNLKIPEIILKENMYRTDDYIIQLKMVKQGSSNTYIT